MYEANVLRDCMSTKYFQPQGEANVPFGPTKNAEHVRPPGEIMERKKISPMFQPGGRTNLGRFLDSLQRLAIDDETSDGCGQKLTELAKEQKFEVNYIDMEHLSISGMID